MKKKLSGKIIEVLMMLCVLCSGSLMSAYAVGEEKPSGEGTIQVNLPDFADLTASLAIYEVGNYNYDGTVTLKEEFSSFTGDLSDIREASKALAAAQSLAEIADGKESLDSVTAFEGNVVFSSLPTDNVLFLVLQTAGEEVIDISPMLVVLSYRTETGSSINAVIDAKYEDKRIPEEPVGAVVLIKKGENDKLLPGAHFRFEFKNYVMPNAVENTNLEVSSDEKGDYYWDLVAADLKTDKNGQIAAENLPFGTYRFIETQAPEGYVLNEKPRVFDIDKAGRIELKEDIGEYVAKDGDPVFLIFKNDLGTTPPESSIPEYESEVSPPPSSTPVISIPSTPSTPSEPSNPPIITGEDVAKFIIIGVVVGVSLIAVVLLIVLGKKKKTDTDDDDE